MNINYELNEKIDEWLNAFEDEEKPILLNLLEQFYYYSEQNVKKKVCTLYDEFCSQYDEFAEQTIYTAVKKDFSVGYSDLVFNTFWFENNLYDYALPDITDLLNNGEVPDFIAIIDDYSGTGNTFIKTLQKLIDINSAIIEKKIFFLTIHITKTAIDNIKSFSDYIGMDVCFVYLDESEKIFKGNYVYKEIEAEALKRGYLQISDRKNINQEYALGFEQIESLVAFHYNTPNNTLGLFWHDLDGFVALFPRHKKKRTSLYELQKKARQRSKSNQITVNYGIDDSRLSVFMAYCVSMERGFSFIKAMNDFGFTNEQLSSTIQKMVEQGYILPKKGCFIPSPKLKSKMFYNRCKQLKESYISKIDADSNLTFNTENGYIPKKF